MMCSIINLSAQCGQLFVESTELLDCETRRDLSFELTDGVGDNWMTKCRRVGRREGVWRLETRTL